GRHQDEDGRGRRAQPQVQVAEQQRHPAPRAARLLGRLRPPPTGALGHLNLVRTHFFTASSSVSLNVVRVVMVTLYSCLSGPTSVRFAVSSKVPLPASLRTLPSMQQSTVMSKTIFEPGVSTIFSSPAGISLSGTSNWKRISPNCRPSFLYAFSSLPVPAALLKSMSVFSALSNSLKNPSASSFQVSLTATAFLG